MSEELPDDCPENTADTCGVCETKTQRCYYLHYGWHCTSEDETAGGCCRHMINTAELEKDRPDELVIDEDWVPYCFLGSSVNRKCRGQYSIFLIGEGDQNQFKHACRECVYRKRD